MSKGGGSNTTNTVQKADPWEGVQPYLKGGLSDLSKWYSSDYGRQPFPGSTVVPFNPLTEQALGTTAQRAISGSPLTRSAQGTLQDTLSGRYLDPSSNPWLSGTFDLAAGKVRSALDSQFNSAGGYGGSLHQGAMAENLGDLATKLYGGQYGDERTRQIQGMMFAPQMANQDYFDASQLANVGSAYEQQAGNYLNDAVSRYNFSQNQPYNRLQQFFGIANPTAGQGGTTQSTSTQPSNSNPLSNILGIGSSIAGIGNSLGLFGSAAAAAPAFGSAGWAAATLPLIFSDPDVKTDIAPVADEDVLQKFKRTPASEYRYREELGPKFGGLRVGPMADDFAREFGGDGHTIPMPKLLGVLWAAVPALTRKIEALEEKVAA